MISKELIGILIGGFAPAVLFAVSSVLSKQAMISGISKPLYLIMLGVAVLTCGIIFYIFFPDKQISYRSATYTFVTGVAWALGTSLFALALTYYGIPLSKLVPLNNTSTLFAILISLWIFAEWQQVNVLKLFLGAGLIIAGSVIVVKA